MEPVAYNTNPFGRQWNLADMGKYLGSKPRRLVVNRYAGSYPYVNESDNNATQGDNASTSESSIQRVIHECQKTFTDEKQDVQRMLTYLTQHANADDLSCSWQADIDNSVADIKAICRGGKVFLLVNHQNDENQGQQQKQEVFLWQPNQEMFVPYQELQVKLPELKPEEMSKPKSAQTVSESAKTSPKSSTKPTSSVQLSNRQLSYDHQGRLEGTESNQYVCPEVSDNHLMVPNQGVDFFDLFMSLLNLGGSLSDHQRGFYGEDIRYNTDKEYDENGTFKRMITTSQVEDHELTSHVEKIYTDEEGQHLVSHRQVDVYKDPRQVSEETIYVDKIEPVAPERQEILQSKNPVFKGVDTAKPQTKNTKISSGTSITARILNGSLPMQSYTHAQTPDGKKFQYRSYSRNGIMTFYSPKDKDSCVSIKLENGHIRLMGLAYNKHDYDKDLKLPQDYLDVLRQSPEAKAQMCNILQEIMNGLTGDKQHNYPSLSCVIKTLYASLFMDSKDVHYVETSSVPHLGDLSLPLVFRKPGSTITVGSTTISQKNKHNNNHAISYMYDSADPDNQLEIFDSSGLFRKPEWHGNNAVLVGGKPLKPVDQGAPLQTGRTCCFFSIASSMAAMECGTIKEMMNNFRAGYVKAHPGQSKDEVEQGLKKLAQDEFTCNVIGIIQAHFFHDPSDFLNDAVGLKFYQKHEKRIKQIQEKEEKKLAIMAPQARKMNDKNTLNVVDEPNNGPLKQNQLASKVLNPQLSVDKIASISHDTAV